MRGVDPVAVEDDGQARHQAGRVARADLAVLDPLHHVIHEVVEGIGIIEDAREAVRLAPEAPGGQQAVDRGVHRRAIVGARSVRDVLVLFLTRMNFFRAAFSTKASTSARSWSGTS
jgi:hypothetical protein